MQRYENKFIVRRLWLRVFLFLTFLGISIHVIQKEYVYLYQENEKRIMKDVGLSNNKILSSPRMWRILGTVPQCFIFIN